MKMFDEQFLVGKEVINKIEQHGYQAYFVGGCVRDLLLDNQTKDIDIATSAFPNTIVTLFDKVIPLGVEHGTVIVRHKKTSFEVTTFRLEGTYSDQRHPDKVEFIDHINLDLQRRDFTINALAMDKEGKIIDLFNGQEDLNQCLIRYVGDGGERFKEDPLRIIRAIRFASQLGFTIEKKTISEIQEVKPSLEKIAVERITNELEKLVAGKDINKGIYYLRETGVYRYLPTVRENPNIINKLPDKLEPMESFGEFIALAHFIEPDISVKTWVKQWKNSNRIKSIALNLVDALFYYKKTQTLDSWLVYNLNTNLYHSFIRLINAVCEDNLMIDENEFMQLVKELPIKSKKELDIDGNDIIRMFPKMTKGPWIQQVFNQLEKKVVLGNIDNNYEKLKEWIKWNPPENN